MAGRVADNRVRYGSLKLEDSSKPGTMLAFDCVPTSVAIVPGVNENAGDDPVEVLCGATTGGSSSTVDRVATLDITIVSDFLEQGLVAYSWASEGERAFEWVPNSLAVKDGATVVGNNPAQVWKGTVNVLPIEVGGEVNARLSPSVSWKITSLELPSIYGGGMWIGAAVAGIAPPSGGSKEWTFTPANALSFPDLATLKTDGAVGDGGAAKPNRDFTVGEYATIAGGTKVSYKVSGGWAAGAAQ